MTTIKKYWDDRYKAGGNSGRGSYGVYKTYKSKVINNIIIENEIQSVTDFGCGDGNQIDDIKPPKYVGLDIAPSSVNLCSKKYSADKTKSFDVYDHTTYDKTHPAEMSMSIDVMYHIFEDNIYEKYLSDLFENSSRFVLVYSTNFDEKYNGVHVKNREFTKDIPEGWVLKEHIKNETDNYADFYLFIKE
jgi:hypothetical protein